jgi:hypothetical protein
MPAPPIGRVNLQTLDGALESAPQSIRLSRDQDTALVNRAV